YFLPHASRVWPPAGRFGHVRRAGVRDRVRRDLPLGAAHGGHARRAGAHPRRRGPRLRAGARTAPRAHRRRGPVNVSIRRASPDDLDFLTELLAHVEVQPFLAAARAADREGIETDIARSSDKPDEFGLFMIEVDGVRA